MDADTTFEEFHEIIQYAFGWEFSHLYLFSEKGYNSPFRIEDPGLTTYDNDGAGDSTKIKLRDIFKKEKQTYMYIYDFGDSWERKITLELISEVQTKFPVCIAGKGKCPLEDCGGAWAYQDLKETLNDPDHLDHKEYRDWLGLEDEDVWDSKEFDIKEVNSVLKNLI